jgi:chorismate mutase
MVGQKESEMEKAQLSALNDAIAKTDAELVLILGQRMNLVTKVANIKIKNGRKIVRKGVEDERTKKVIELACAAGLNPEFMQAIYYLIILQSCRVQIMVKEGSQQVS